MSDGYTKGPWPVKNTVGGKRIIVGVGLIDGPNGYNVAEVYSDDCDRDEAIANARLISAAPDLLEALEKAIADAEGAIRVDGMMLDWMDAARAAIAKARGAGFAPRADDVGQNDA